MDETQRIARVFKVLSVESRLRIVEMLRERPLCVGALSHRLDITQGAVSQHLRVLRDAGLVTAHKHGYFVHYSLSREEFLALRKTVDAFLAVRSGAAKAPLAKGKPTKRR
ncbi:MAG: winged helix-turn-helix transcriptional regulator [Planctomycetes bacterium]|nr:winged helix-turn-helix transcriptional regulator [Planctomycetota bacterium]